MIQAKDLMVGNWVLNPNTNKPEQITARDISDIQSNLKTMYPIFYKESIVFKFDIKGWDFEIGYVGDDFINQQATLRINKIILLKVKHIHQVQNICKALSGKDIEIKF